MGGALDCEAHDEGLRRFVKEPTKVPHVFTLGEAAYATLEEVMLHRAPRRAKGVQPTTAASRKPEREIGTRIFFPWRFTLQLYDALALCHTKRCARPSLVRQLRVDDDLERQSFLVGPLIQFKRRRDCNSIVAAELSGIDSPTNATCRTPLGGEFFEALTTESRGHLKHEGRLSVLDMCGGFPSRYDVRRC